ncbi:MAG: glycosyltransferase family 2 protein [Candidatus Hodarchaeales archaeon]|jgi:glycosyltransferase involved in cell wall biosynthesis
MTQEIIPIIIPCRNELSNLKILIKLFANIPENFKPILVDNGSSDGSSILVKKKGWDVVYEPRIGYGNACQRGLEYVTSKYSQSKHIGFFDADLSEHPNDLLFLFKISKKFDLDIILGSRHEFFHRMPAKVRVANIFFARLINILYRYPLKDNGPMRIIKSEILKELNMSDNYYGWTFEMTIKAIKLKKRLGEVPIQHFTRFSGNSKISGDFLNSLLSLFQITTILIKYIR